MRATFWGLALWGAVTLVLPTAALYYTVMVLGTLALLAICIRLTRVFLDWLDENFDLERDER